MRLDRRVRSRQLECWQEGNPPVVASRKTNSQVDRRPSASKRVICALPVRRQGGTAIVE
ncbi:uncharacterized protein BCR38DRAFT_417438 [Pseudomassariella vexata]|uniref:Uncharacterized protein n=1 Tax=Pseudomassariella vexata TaxID=1141098 RepID=A0A1Y2EJW8_9PEZI|nr:uncharacterized protein BCR38DRAFT_417438 [Pseudomassariella vexata]ORY71586.1 hypothetical protein BCR38DRAFT_417438 [Pseudomassariella vexata]